MATIVLGDEVLTPDSSRFWPADGYEPGRGQPSFDKQFVRDWASGSGWDKTPPAPELPDDVVEGTRERYVEAYERIAGEPFGRWLERSAVKARVLIRPKEGILDPQGQAVERALPALGFEGVSNVRVGRLVELEVDDPAAVPEMCERLLANPLIEDYEVHGGGVKFGVVRFPGSCDEVDALLACRRFGEAELLWHGDRDLARRGRRGGARRLLLRRLPARRGDRPLLAGDGVGDRVRARRRPGARHLQRLPGAVRGGAAAGRAAAQPRAALRLPPGRPRSWRTPTRPSRERVRPASVLSIPVKHTTGRFYAPEQYSTSSRQVR